MGGASPFVDDPSDTREAIMAATYLALAEHGYADLTIQRIGDEFEKSKSLLYHHYEGKDDLLVDFLEFMLEHFEEAIPFEESEGADAILDTVLDNVLLSPPDDGHEEFFRTMVELRAQSAHDAAYRDYFARSDQFFRDRIADLIREGIEEGVFREVDPEATATLLQTIVVGAMFQRATTGEGPGRPLREEVDAYVRARLLVDEGSD